MPNMEDDYSFFIYADSINAEAFDNAQNSQNESGDGFNMSEGTQNMGDAGLVGQASGEGGASMGNGASAGIGM